MCVCVCVLFVSRQCDGEGTALHTVELVQHSPSQPIIYLGVHLVPSGAKRSPVAPHGSQGSISSVCDASIGHDVNQPCGWYLWVSFTCEGPRDGSAIVCHRRRMLTVPSFLRSLSLSYWKISRVTSVGNLLRRVMSHIKSI